MQSYPPPYTPSPYVPPAPSKKSGKTWLWVLGGCGCFSVLAIAVIIGIILLSTLDGDSGNADMSPVIGKELRDLKMARILDDDNLEFTSSFSTRETKVACVIYPRRLEVGERYVIHWYAERVRWWPRNRLVGKGEFPVITPETRHWVWMRIDLNLGNGFPPGLYRLEVTRDGSLVGTIRFKIE